MGRLRARRAWRRRGPRAGALRSRSRRGVGAAAGLVVLDRNPLAVEPMAIKDIRVLQTIKEGRVIHEAA